MSISNLQFINPLYGLGKYPVLVGALFWKSQKKDVIPTQNAVNIETIQHADQLFEIGHYEECYQYLKNYQVSKYLVSEKKKISLPFQRI